MNYKYKNNKEYGVLLLMVYRDYICDACGFITEEEPGVYKCPKCGNQMRAAKMAVMEITLQVMGDG